MSEVNDLENEGTTGAEVLERILQNPEAVDALRVEVERLAKLKGSVIRQQEALNADIKGLAKGFNLSTPYITSAVNALARDIVERKVKESSTVTEFLSLFLKKETQDEDIEQDEFDDE